EAKAIPSGMEICEVQLMSSANKIHHTEINHEIDKYLDSINELFKNTSKDELIKKFFSVEFTRFYNYYQKTSDLNIAAQESIERDTRNENTTRLFINVGKKVSYYWMNLKNFLRFILHLVKDDFFKVDVKDNLSFYNTEYTDSQKGLDLSTHFKNNGR